MLEPPKRPGSFYKKDFKVNFFCTVSEIACVGSRFRSPGRIYTNIDHPWPDSTRIYINTGRPVLGRLLFYQKYVFSEPTDPKARWWRLPRHRLLWPPSWQQASQQRPLLARVGFVYRHFHSQGTWGVGYGCYKARHRAIQGGKGCGAPVLLQGSAGVGRWQGSPPRFPGASRATKSALPVAPRLLLANKPCFWPFAARSRPPGAGSGGRDPPTRQQQAAA